MVGAARAACRRNHMGNGSVFGRSSMMAFMLLEITLSRGAPRVFPGASDGIDLHLSFIQFLFIQFLFIQFLKINWANW